VVVVQRHRSGRGPRGAAEQRRGAREGPHRVGREEARGGWSCAGGRERGGTTDTDPRRRFLSFACSLGAFAFQQQHARKPTDHGMLAAPHVAFEMVGR